MDLYVPVALLNPGFSLPQSRRICLQSSVLFLPTAVYSVRLHFHVFVSLVILYMVSLSFIIQKLFSQPSVLLREELLYKQVSIWCICGGGEVFYVAILDQNQAMVYTSTSPSDPPPMGKRLPIGKRMCSPLAHREESFHISFKVQVSSPLPLLLFLVIEFFEKMDHLCCRMVHGLGIADC